MKTTMFSYCTSDLPEPGAGPSVALTALATGVFVLGMAPCGIRWRAKVTGPGRLKLEGNCPRYEFVPTHAYVGGKWMEIR